MVSWSMKARETFQGGVSLEPGELLLVDDVVVLPVHMRTRGAASGLVMQTEFAYVFRFRGDKVASAATYPTVSSALEAAKDSRRT